MIQLAKMMEETGTTSVDLAAAIGADRSAVWRWLNRNTRPHGDSVDALLAFFSKRLGRTVRYEELFPRKKGRAA